MELIIIKTNKSQEIKKLLAEKCINYEIFTATSQPHHQPQPNWELKEKLALQEWEKLSDKELIAEWEKLPDNGRENN